MSWWFTGTAPAAVTVAVSAGIVTFVASRTTAQTNALTPLTVQQLAERVSTGAWDTFSARITVRRQVVNPGISSDGSSTAALPAAMTDEFEWRRVQTGDGWKTTVTVISGTRPMVRSRAGLVPGPEPPGIARIEDDENGTLPRFFTGTGVQLSLPLPRLRDRVVRPGVGVDPALIAQSGAYGAPPGGRGRQWIQSFIMPGGSKPGRLDALRRQFGPPRGTVRGLAQYVHDDADGWRELLVDESAAVPIESNLVKNGALVSHSTLTYDGVATGALVRRGVRVERSMEGDPPDSSARLVTDVTYSNIRVDMKGGR